jgi:hypothetical protein
VGLHAGDLVAAASNPAQTVICAAGGSYKRQAVCDAALGFGPGRSIANRFILDSSAASYWMSHAKYPKRVIDAVHQVHASSHR